MKKIVYILSAVALLFTTSCADMLNTEPTNKVSGSTILKDAESAEAAINGIYRAIYVSGWSENWPAENFGQTSVNLLSDLMGEDHLMAAQGQGWFWYDYLYGVHGDYASKSGRSYSLWNFYYTIVTNANYIIAAHDTMEGDPTAVTSVVAQAYSMRAFAYFYLIQIYQQTYLGNEDAAGVPLYTEPTVAGSVGAPRGTVQGVYEQINSDLEVAIDMFASIGNETQSHASHVDYYVANGLKARVNLVQHNYETAALAAAEAMKRGSVASVAQMGGNNSVSASNTLWGFEIIADQSTHFSSFFSHMDADAPGMYASKARQCISSGLYDLIPDNDDRKAAWFMPPTTEEGGGSTYPYCQIKFQMADYTTRTGDNIIMRVEEMILIKAEAECHQGKYSEARATIALLGEARNSDYATLLATRTDSKSYDADTNKPVITLMEEILLQRRVELWGENGRVFDLQRLSLGVSRAYDGTNHTATVTTKDVSAGSPLFILPLPQSEIDGNENISSSDQNPIVQ